jgi:hypothetical protein
MELEQKNATLKDTNSCAIPETQSVVTMQYDDLDELVKETYKCLNKFELIWRKEINLSTLILLKVKRKRAKD